MPCFIEHPFRYIFEPVSNYLRLIPRCGTGGQSICTVLGLLHAPELPSRKSVPIYIPHSTVSKCLFLEILSFS